MRRGPPFHIVVLLSGLLAVLYGAVVAFLPAPLPALQPEARPLSCDELHDAALAPSSPTSRRLVDVRSTSIVFTHQHLACGRHTWPVLSLPMDTPPGEQQGIEGDSTVTVELQGSAMDVRAVCAGCGERGFRRGRVRTRAEIEAARPLGRLTLAGGLLAVLGAATWTVVRRRRSDNDDE